MKKALKIYLGMNFYKTPLADFLFYLFRQNGINIPGRVPPRSSEFFTRIKRETVPSCSFHRGCTTETSIRIME